LDFSTVLIQLKEDNRCFNYDDFASFIWKDFSDPNNPKFLSSSTFKVWLKLISDRILSYNGKNERILEFKDILESLSPSFLLDTDGIVKRRYFNSKELKTGLKIWDMILNLVGHGTVRLAFSQMLDYYKAGELVNLRILTRPSESALIKGLRLIGVISPTYLSAQKFTISPKGGVSFGNQRIRHLLGLSTLQGYIHMPILNQPNSQDNALLFPLGPLPYIDTISTKPHIRQFSLTISDIFSAKFNNFFGTVSATTEFIKDQNNLLKTLFREIDDNSIFFDRAHNKWQSNTMSMLALSQLFDRELKSPKTGQDFLRGQIPASLNLRGNYIPLRFADIPIEGVHHFDETIFIERAVFEKAGTVYRYWPRLEYKNDFTTQKYEDARFRFINGKIDDTIQELINLIDDEAGGIVEVSTLVNSYEESLGYQFLVPVEGYDQYDNKEFLAKFTIDTSQASDAKVKLKYILKLMMTDDLVFLFTDSKPTITNKLATFNKLYFAFNFRGFLTKGDIFSLMRTARKKYAFYNNLKVTFSSQHSFDFKENQEKWVHIWSGNYVYYSITVFREKIYNTPILPYSSSF
jgi:hypothetical protein